MFFFWLLFLFAGENEKTGRNVSGLSCKWKHFMTVLQAVLAILLRCGFCHRLNSVLNLSIESFYFKVWSMYNI